MAQASYEELKNDLNVRVVKWVLTDSNTEGEPYPYSSRYPDKNVQMYGTWNGATIDLEGSNEVESPATFATLHKLDLTDLEMAADGIEQVLQNTFYVRPKVSSGTLTSVTVLLCVRS